MNRFVRMILFNLPRFISAYCKLCRYARHPERYSYQEKWDHIHGLFSMCMGSSNVDLTVTGLENIPREESFVLYGNHQGLFDIMAVAATCPVPLGAVYKQEMKNVPFMKQLFACTNSFPMDRTDVRQSLQVIQNVTKEVLNNHSYLIFPEGTRSKLGNTMLPFHPGSFRAAMKANCPIVPMALIDSYKPLDQKGSAPVAAQLHYLPPIPYEEYKDMKTTEVAELVKSRIAATIEANT